MDIFAGIDGTDSEKWIDHPGRRATNSHVYDFYLKLNTQGGAKRYYEGPAASGGNVREIANEIENYVRREHGCRPLARICLVGHSRGGLIAILVARALRDCRKVHFLGLYDAVDRTFAADGNPIENVVLAYHAIRNSWRGSNPVLGVEAPHWAYGNTGTRAAGDVAYFRKEFFAIHAAIGGNLPTGDSFYDRIDRYQGPEAHRWMMEMARRHGILVS